MNKVRIGSDAFPYPMPMVMVGSVVEGRENFMPVAWMARAHPDPPMLVFAAGQGHYTNKGIEEHGQFGVSVPSREQIEVVDYCGLVSGEDQDKSGLFDVFYGELRSAPMISECPVAMECRVFSRLDLPKETLFVGEIVAAYSEERFLIEGVPDIRAIDPFCLTQPDNHYWSIGEMVGDAWKSGRNFEVP